MNPPLCSPSPDSFAIVIERAKIVLQQVLHRKLRELGFADVVILHELIFLQSGETCHVTRVAQVGLTERGIRYSVMHRDRELSSTDYGAIPPPQFLEDWTVTSM